MELDNLKERINTFCLNNCPRGNQGYNRVLVQLLGYTGHGKSSLINSCKYVLGDREFILHAQAAPVDGGLTMDRKTYQLTSSITMVDNRGWSMMNAFETGEIYAQLGNLLPLNQPVEWTKEYQDMLFRVEDADIEPNFTDFIVPVFVYSVKKDIAASEAAEITLFLKNCRDLTGIVPIIVLTNKTNGNYCKTRDMFEGMGAEEIFAVENYTEEDCRKTRGRHAQFLKILHSVLEDVDFHMKEERNPKRERAERKKFVLKFVHDRESKT